MNAAFGGRTVLQHVLDFYETYRDALGGDAVVRGQIVTRLDSEAAKTRVRRIANLFATVIYPMMVAVWGFTKSGKDNFTAGMVSKVMATLSNAVVKASAHPHVLAQGQRDIFGNPVQCSYNSESLSWQTQKPIPLKVKDDAYEVATAKENLPEGVRTHGINKYLGAQGVRKPLIPPPDKSNDARFMASMLHLVHCGLLRELLVYTHSRFDAPRPINLTPASLRGRAASSSASFKIRAT